MNEENTGKVRDGKKCRGKCGIYNQRHEYTRRFKVVVDSKKNSSISVVFLVVVLVMAVCMAAPTGGVCVANCLRVQIFIQLKRIIIESESRTKRNI